MGAGPILVAGEALMDVVGEGDVLRGHPGGGPYNTARTLGRLERPVAFLGCLSTDAFGATLRAGLEADGVSVAAAVAVDAPTTLALATVGDGGGARYSFYAAGTSAPALTTAATIAALPSDLAMLHVGTLGLVFEPIAEALEAAVGAVGEQVLVALDPNCRPGAIADHAAYRTRIARIAARSDLVKVSDEDLAFLRPGEDPVDAARALLATGPAVVVVTRGAAGATIVGHAGVEDVPAPPVEVVDTIGAGDAFGGGLLAWWHARGLGAAELRTEPAALREAVAFAARVAARTCERAGADPPRADEMPGWRP